MKMIKEHTYGAHVYAELELDNGERCEVDAYVRETGWVYKTTGDADESKRAEIIAAFNALY